MQSRHLFETCHQGDVLLKILALESWQAATHVVLFEPVHVLDGAGQKAAAKRAERHESDPQLATRGKDRALGNARPERIFTLKGRDWMDPRGAPERLGSGF